ncbi:MAG: DUF4365 domain-containing protein [Pseudomonadota bacterium]
MSKKITESQRLGELGEAAARKRFLEIGFQFDGRSRIEAGIDGIAEVMDRGKPLARMIAVQVKATGLSKYTAETEDGFTYLLNSEDLEYWKPSNLPIIIVLYRHSDESFFWKQVDAGAGVGKRKLTFNKHTDALNRDAVDQLAALTVPKTGFGYYVPPLGDGEDALINMMPVRLPSEMFVASTEYSPKKAIATLLDGDAARFDWVIHGRSFWSFHDPRLASTSEIVDLDQVESIETSLLADHEDIQEQNNFAYLLRQVLRHQEQKDLRWHKEKGYFYFAAEEANTDRYFAYRASKNDTEANVVNVVRDKDDPDRVLYVRHHAFIPRFERLLDEWFLIVTPTYYFTTNGMIPHSYPDALLSGKKRMDNNASLRGQVIMWHRFLTAEPDAGDLFAEPEARPERAIIFGEPPSIALPTRVPEDVWAASKPRSTDEDTEPELELDFDEV